jgi:hypothetical protein
MPTLSASDYTRYLKLKSAATSYQNGQVPKAVQTTDQVVPVASVLFAEVLASQAAYVINPQVTTIVGNARVQGQQVPQFRSTPTAKSTLSWTSGTSGSVGSLSSSPVQRPGGLPTDFKSSQNTYHRIPQQAGW